MLSTLRIKIPSEMASICSNPSTDYLNGAQPLKVLQDGPGINHVSVVKYRGKTLVQKRANRNTATDKRLAHEYGIRTYIGSACDDITPPMELYRTVDYTFGVTKYLGPNQLFDLIENESISKTLALQIFKQLVKSVLKLHAAGVAHGDISPENIIMVSNNKPMLIDFGLSEKITAAAVPARGKLAYVDPIALESGVMTDMTASDAWSIGVTFLSMYMRSTPWEVAHTSDERFQYAQQHGLKALLVSWNITMPDKFMEVVTGLLSPELKSRMSLVKADQILNSC